MGQRKSKLHSAPCCDDAGSAADDSALFLDEIPDDVLVHLLGFTATQNLRCFANLRLVNRRWNRLVARLITHERDIDLRCRVTPKGVVLKRTHKASIPVTHLSWIPKSFRISFHLSFKPRTKKNSTSIAFLEGHDKNLVDVLDRIPNIDKIYCNTVAADLFGHQKMATVRCFRFNLVGVTTFGIERIFAKYKEWREVEAICFDYPKDPEALERFIELIAACYKDLPQLYKVEVTTPFLEEAAHDIAAHLVTFVQDLMKLRRNLFVRIKMKRTDFYALASGLNANVDDHVLSSMFTIALSDGWIMEFLWMQMDFSAKLHNVDFPGYDGNFLPKFL